jgi:hypothetical protein
MSLAINTISERTRKAQRDPKTKAACEEIANNPQAALERAVAKSVADPSLMAEWLWRFAQRDRQRWLPDPQNGIAGDAANSAGPLALGGKKRGAAGAWFARLCLKMTAASAKEAGERSGPFSEPPPHDLLRLLPATMKSWQSGADPIDQSIAFQLNVQSKNGEWAHATITAAQPGFDWFGLVSKAHGSWDGFFPGATPGPLDRAASPLQTLVGALLRDAARERLGQPSEVDQAALATMLAPLFAWAQEDALRTAVRDSKSQPMAISADDEATRPSPEHRRAPRL